MRIEALKRRLNQPLVRDIIIASGFEVNKNFKFKIRNERTASASISSNGYINDFGGDFSGDIFEFLMKFKNMNFKESLKYVADILNYDENEDEYSGILANEEKISLNEMASNLQLEFQKNKAKAVKEIELLFSKNFLEFFGIRQMEGFLGYSKKYKALAYIFRNEQKDTKAIAYNSRFAGKKRIREKGSKNSFIMSNLALNDDIVIITEGVSEPLILETLGFNYICFQNAGEMANAQNNPQFQAFKERIKGKKVYIIADNDQAGFSAAKKVANSLECVASELYIVDFENERRGFDLRDLILKISKKSYDVNSFEKEFTIELSINAKRIFYEQD